MRQTVYALVPARNEPGIAATVASLLGQTHPPYVVVVANNCTDDTAERARAAGAYVIDMPDNPGRKAGALNYGLTALDDELADGDAVVIMDADSVITSTFIADALPHLGNPADDVEHLCDDECGDDSHPRDGRITVEPRRPGAGAVSGAFEAVRVPGFLPLLQRTEFAQARHRIGQRAGNVNVLSGAAAVFTVQALRAVRAARGTVLPGTPGDWYDVGSLTEDYEITLAVKALGWAPVSPAHLRVDTDVMRTVSELWQQRIRWQHGYLRDTARYPLAMTWRSWLVQGWAYLAALIPILAVVLTVQGLATGGQWTPGLVWLAVVPVFVAAEVFSARRAGWPAMLLAASVLPMWAYAMWRNTVYYAAAVRVTRTATATAVWH
jgi:biofilm PGA synthesis N-glycosyltransferase PgaC